MADQADLDISMIITSSLDVRVGGVKEDTMTENGPINGDFEELADCCTLITIDDESHDTPDENYELKMATKTRVVLLACGSFNPITNMHLRMFEIAKDSLHKTGRFEVIEGIVSPVSDGYKKKDLEPAKHRCEMVRRSLKTSSWIRLDTWESDQDTWTETARILAHHKAQQDSIYNANELRPTRNSELPAKKKRKTNAGTTHVSCNMLHNQADGQGPVQVKLLCGGDLLESFAVPGLWKPADIEDIVRNYGLVCITREGSNPSRFIYENDVLSKFQYNIHIVTEWITNDISATKIRRALRRQESVKYLVQDAVIDYIMKNSLYGVEVADNKYIDSMISSPNTNRPGVCIEYLSPEQNTRYSSGYSSEDISPSNNGGSRISREDYSNMSIGETEDNDNEKSEAKSAEEYNYLQPPKVVKQKGNVNISHFLSGLDFVDGETNQGSETKPQGETAPVTPPPPPPPRSPFQRFNPFDVAGEEFVFPDPPSDLGQSINEDDDSPTYTAKYGEETKELNNGQNISDNPSEPLPGKYTSSSSDETTCNDRSASPKIHSPRRKPKVVTSAESKGGRSSPKTGSPSHKHKPDVADLTISNGSPLQNAPSPKHLRNMSPRKNSTYENNLKNTASPPRSPKRQSKDASNRARKLRVSFKEDQLDVRAREPLLSRPDTPVNYCDDNSAHSSSDEEPKIVQGTGGCADVAHILRKMKKLQMGCGAETVV